MIKQIRTYNAKLLTPEGEYLVVDVVDASDKSIYAVVTDIESFGIDERKEVFYHKPYAIIVSGNWQLMFTDEVPSVINIWQDKGSTFEGGDTSELDDAVSALIECVRIASRNAEDV